MKNKAIIILSILVLGLGVLNYKQRELLNLYREVHTQLVTLHLLKDKTHQNDLKSLKNYYLISVRMNNIIDKNQSSRNLKFADSELIEMMAKID